MEQEIVKSQNRTKVRVAVIGLLGILVGTFGMEFYNQYTGRALPSEINTALVEQHNGVYIFLRSRPATNTHTTLGHVNSNAFSRAVDGTKGKKGFGNVLKGIGNSLIKDLSFDNRLDQIVDDAKGQFPDVEGIILSRDLTQCEAIKY